MTDAVKQTGGWKELMSGNLSGHVTVSYDTPNGRVRRRIPFGESNADWLKRTRKRMDELRAQLEQRKGEE